MSLLKAFSFFYFPGSDMSSKEAIMLSSNHRLFAYWNNRLAKVLVISILIIFQVKEGKHKEGANVEGIPTSEVGPTDKKIYLLFTVYCCLKNTVSAPSDNFRCICRLYVTPLWSISSYTIDELLTVLQLPLYPG